VKLEKLSIDVARQIEAEWGMCGLSGGTLYEDFAVQVATRVAHRVRAQALEEAARVAENMAQHSLPNSLYLSEKCAAAIRALSDPTTG